MGLVGKESGGHDKGKWPSERRVGKRLKRMKVEQRGGRALIDVESGAGPGARPLPEAEGR